MKRSWIKRKRYTWKKRKKAIRKKSPKKRLRDRIGAIHFKILKLERGEKCEITKKTCNDLGRFHILPVGEYPEMEYHSLNVLLVSWFYAHDDWHHDYFKAKAIEYDIKRLRGENYENELKALAVIQPRHTMVYLRGLEKAFEKIYEDLLRGVRT